MENSYAQELLMWSDIIIKYSEKVLEMGQILDNLYRKKQDGEPLTMLDYYKKMELENQLEVYRNLIAKYQEYKKLRNNIKYMNLLPISTSYLIELINENKQILDSLDFELKTRIRCYPN